MTIEGHQARGVSAPARRRGHHAKIAAAVRALRDAGRLPPYLRPTERDRRVVEWLEDHGYGGGKDGCCADLPSPSALARYFSASDSNG
jgi:hypothetical protein